MGRRVRILGGIALLSGIAFFTATVPGCAWKSTVDDAIKESKGWRKQSEEWQKKAEDLQEQIKETNKQIAKFSENMENAAGAIDPLAIKELLKKNETLAKKNAELENIIANPPTGHLVLSGSDLRLDILRFKGKMFVECTIDSPDNLVLRQSLRATEPNLTVDYTLAQTQVVKYFQEKTGHIIRMLSGQMQAQAVAVLLLENEIAPGIGKAAKSADELYKNAVTQAFTNYLKTGAYETPTAEKYRFYLENRFKATGKHTVQFSIKPEPDSPDWDLTVELYLVDHNSGKEKLLIRSQYSRFNDPNPTKLPPIYLDVQYSELKSKN